MNSWRDQLRYDVLPALLNSGNEAIIYFVSRDLLDEKASPADFIRQLPESQKITKKQRPDGAWKKPGKNTTVYPPNYYLLVETFKNFRMLVKRYQFTRDHPSVQKAAEVLLSFQTEDGDIRGFLGSQYATYYTGEILSLLIKAGYEDDPRVESGMRWLLSMRQDDGGWTIPILTHRYDKETTHRLTSQYAGPVEPDRTRPFSHNWTDMVLRAFAAHPGYRKSPEAKAAGNLLKSSFFQPDNYSSYRAARYWTRFAFWWPNLLTALDSLYWLGFTRDDPDIGKGLQWFFNNQQPDGLWKLESDKEIKAKDAEERTWLGLEICRVLKRYGS
ncbi:MAG: hypothetical protein A2Z29_11375 [Chloroflexi bacterium RBG_16_56_11]|nr:MAG: hypothetical protein A2Z29_11375 [Chloroflexi bacterium RBG_16_56_11]